MTDQIEIAFLRLLVRLTESTLLNPNSHSLISKKQMRHDYKLVKKYMQREINRKELQDEQ